MSKQKSFNEAFNERFKDPEKIKKQLDKTPKKLKVQLLGDNSGQRILDIPIILLFEDRVLVTKQNKMY